MPEVVIVALDINRNDDLFNEFDGLSSEEKLAWLERRIQTICEELKTKEPNAAWLVTWREYGITDGVDKRAISQEMKALFKEKMSKLTQTYPNLSIVAGTISTQKHFDSKKEKELNEIDPNEKKLDTIEQYYAEHGWIKERESKVNLEKQQQIAREEKKLKELKQAIPEEGFDVIRNTCYVFNGAYTWRHDKTAPMDETKSNLDLEKALFQPGGSARNLNSLCSIEHPTNKRTAITFGVEICREHEFAVLKNSKINKPLIHFVLSDTTYLKLDHIHGDYAIQLDSTYKPRLILSKDEKSENIPIHFYQNNLLRPEGNLEGPLQPVYPFEKKVLDKLDAIIPALSGIKRNIFENIKANFIKSCDNMGAFSVGSYDCLEGLLIKYKDHLKNDYLIAKFALFSSGPDIEGTVKSLLDLVKTERMNNPKHKDYLAVTDAPRLTIEKAEPTLTKVNK